MDFFNIKYFLEVILAKSRISANSDFHSAINAINRKSLILKTMENKIGFNFLIPYSQFPTFASSKFKPSL